VHVSLSFYDTAPLELLSDILIKQYIIEIVDSMVIGLIINYFNLTPFFNNIKKRGAYYV